MLFWMDLEMTGLDPNTEVIVEIATVVTDDDLTVLAEGPDIVIATAAQFLEKMEPFVLNMHINSGLLEAIKASTVSHEDAMQQTLDFIKFHSPESGKIPLCGNSIGTDRRFLAKYMPEIENWLHYRSVDVSSVKELVKRWYPGLEHARTSKVQTHRALDDIMESIAELKFYREKVFKND